MAKINHNNYLDVVDTIFSSSKNRGLTHINSDEQYFDGKKFTINGKNLKNFGTCGYMGLENHPLLIQGSIELLQKFGTQFSMGRVFMRPKYIRELEELMGYIFSNHKVLCYTSTSTAHISVIATVIKSNDLIILDQQVHFSVQFPAKNTRLQGTEIKMIRHSNFEMLEEMIRENYNKYDRIWYMADGVYSMHGDFPDTSVLKQLMDKYPKLHLYFDDAHGMSWSGKNGAGYIFDTLGINKRIIIISTMAKGFGCVGGTAIIADEELYRKIDIFGGPHSYSHPLTPSAVGAAIASAKIHLTDEIIVMQNELHELTGYMDQLLAKKKLPNISAPYSPIYFIASGYNKVAHNFVNRILNEGFYVNTATFPAVPNDKAGLRFTVTRHVTKKDIEEFVNCLEYHLPRSIEEEGDTIERLYKDYNIPYCSAKKNEKHENQLINEVYTTIKDIDPIIWNKMFENKGNYSHEGLVCMEEIFSNNQLPEENWSFYYLQIKDKSNQIILATFFTCTIYKDDMLSPEKVSKKIEEKRIDDKYFLCSKTIAMGSLFSEGEHLYIDYQNSNYPLAIADMFKFVEDLKDEVKADVILFRDFEPNNPFNTFLEKEGYTQVRMPNSNVINNKKWTTTDELMQIITSAKRRANVKQYAIRHIDKFEVSYKTKITNHEAESYYNLFMNIKNKNLAFNFFPYPRKTPKILANYKEWEFIDIKLKEGTETIAVIWSYIGPDHYIPLIMGLNYDYSDSHQLYKQAVYQMVKRGNILNKNTIFLGFTADFEKKKYMAESVTKYAFIKYNDTYNLEVLESF